MDGWVQKLMLSKINEGAGGVEPELHNWVCNDRLGNQAVAWVSSGDKDTRTIKM